MILHTHFILCECVCRYCTECLQYWMVLLLNLNATDPKTAPTQQFRARNYTYYWFFSPRFLLLSTLAVAAAGGGEEQLFPPRPRFYFNYYFHHYQLFFTTKRHELIFLPSSLQIFFFLNAVVASFLFATCNILRSLETFPIIILDLFFCWLTLGNEIK